MIGQHKVPRRRLLPALCGLALAALPAAACAEEGVFMRDALSRIGLVEPDRPAIAYRERAPLVMPPKLDGRSLPPPRAASADPQWPKDPEIVQRERAAADARKPIVRGAQGRMNDNNMTLSIDEMRSGRRAGAGLPTSGGEAKGSGDTRESVWMNPFDLMRGASDKTEPTMAEPDRDILTDPPTGYRKAPTRIAKTAGEPINDPSREREEADPGAYYRSRGR